MHISCVICGDLCVQLDDISAAPCGHTFHSVCLIQWIEISKSCPQCRQSATEKNILKLFFDAGDSDNGGEVDPEVDPDTLQQQIKNLEFQIRISDQEVSKVKDDNKTLSACNEKLRKECKSQAISNTNIIMANVGLRSRLKCMEQMNSEAQQKAKENARASLQNVDTARSETADNVRIILTAEFCIFKMVLQKYRDKNSGLRVQIKELRNNLDGVSAQLSSSEQGKKLLETDVLSLENENASLRKKVDALQSAIVSPSGDVKSSALHCLIAESPDPSNLKRPQTSDDEVMVATPKVVRKVARLEAEEDDDLEYLGSYSRGASQVSSSPQNKLIFLHGRKPLADKTNASQSSRKSHHNIVAKNKPMLNVDINQLPNKSSQPDSSQIDYNGRPWRSCKKKTTYQIV